MLTLDQFQEQLKNHDFNLFDTWKKLWNREQKEEMLKVLSSTYHGNFEWEIIYWEVNWHPTEKRRYLNSRDYFLIEKIKNILGKHHLHYKTHDKIIELACFIDTIKLGRYYTLQTIPSFEDISTKAETYSSEDVWDDDDDDGWYEYPRQEIHNR